jgi:Cell Wall Hydrolase
MNDTTILLPGQIEVFTGTFMLALAIYREARGEDLTGKVAVGCVIRNRVQHPGWYGRNWFAVITKPYQFSSFNVGDRNSAVFGSATDRAWQDSPKRVRPGSGTEKPRQMLITAIELVKLQLHSPSFLLAPTLQQAGSGIAQPPRQVCPQALLHQQHKRRTGIARCGAEVCSERQ